MATTKDVSIFFSKIAFLILLIGVVVKSSVVPNKLVNPLTNPCSGAGNWRVRAIDSESSVDTTCGKYVQCVDNDPNMPETCPNDAPYFDAITGECGQNRDVCFQCPNREYALMSVPNVPEQFILCFKGKTILSSCEGNLHFDGSPGVHQCNYNPAPEDSQDYENDRCPRVGNEPFYKAEAGVYFVCYGQERPLRLECPNGLIFNEEKGICVDPNGNIEMAEIEPNEE